MQGHATDLESPLVLSQNPLEVSRHGRFLIFRKCWFFDAFTHIFFAMQIIDERQEKLEASG